MNYSKSLDDIISENLQHYRNQAHLTQAELAEKLNVSTSHIANIERKESSVSLSLIQKILDLFQITPNDLMLEKSSAEQLTKDQQLNAVITEKLESARLEIIAELSNISAEEKKAAEYSIPIRPRQKVQTVASPKKNK